MAFGLPMSFGGGFDLGVGLANVGSALFGRNPNEGMMAIYQQMQNPLLGVQAAQQAATDDFIAQLRNQQFLIQGQAQQEAQAVKREGIQFMKGQSFAASNSGVLIEGSPVALLEETRQYTKSAIQQIMSNASIASRNVEYQISAARNESKARMFGQNIAFQTDRANQMAGLAGSSGSGLSAAIGGLGNLFSGVSFAGLNPFGQNKSQQATGGLFSNVPSNWLGT